MKKIISLLLALLLLVGSVSIIVSCDGEENETVAGSEETDSNTESGEGEESDSSTESDTSDITPPHVDGTDTLFDNGGKVSGAGASWNPTAFAIAEFTINENSAKEISADDLLTILKNRENSLTKDDVYIVKGALKLSSNNKYYGNHATVIATDGIIVENESEIVVKELIFKGGITIKGSSDITFFKLGLSAGAAGITVDESSNKISLKSCRILADETAITANGTNVTLYQTYIHADKCVISNGDDLSVHSCEFIANTSAIHASGKRAIIRNNNISSNADGSGIELDGNPYNALVALNVVKDAQVSIKVTGGYNCVVLLNSAIRIVGSDNVNLYVVENNLGGEIVLKNNKYLLCDANVFIKDDKEHIVVNYENTEINGDNLHNVNERVQYGANEELLPHTNKDLFVGMDKSNKVNDVSLTKKYNIDKYIRNMAKNGDKVIIPPGYYISTSRLELGSAHSNTTIYGYGVYHEAVEYGNTMQFVQTKNLSVKGLTVGYAKQSSGQIYVLDKLGNNRILVVAAAGYDKDFGKSNPDVYSTSYTDMFHAGEFCCWKGQGGGYKVISKNPDGTMVFEITDSDGDASNGDNSPKVYASTNVGDIWACRMAGSNQQSIYLYDCTNFLMKDCVTY